MTNTIIWEKERRGKRGKDERIFFFKEGGGEVGSVNHRSDILIVNSVICKHNSVIP
jgi:hypothetical protein